MVATVACASPSERADESACPNECGTQHRTDRARKCVDSDSGSEQKSDAPAGGRAGELFGRHPAPASRDKRRGDGAEDPPDNPADPKARLSCGVPDDGTERTTEPAEETADDKEEKRRQISSVR